MSIFLFPWGLWKVDNYYTSQFMVLFYKALKKSNKIEALYRARIELMEKHKKRHLYYWSVVILIGDYR